MSIKAVDLSSYNTVTSFSGIREDGYEYAILRITNKNNTTDTKFKAFHKGCRSAGLKVGVYKYSYAKNTEDAEREAEYVIALLKDYPIELPVFYDLEDSSQESMTKSAIGRIANAFIAKIKAAGYRCGVYSNQNWYLNILDPASINADYWWIAKYSSIAPAFKCDGWQYSSTSRVKGIEGVCDTSIFYTKLDEEDIDMARAEELQKQIDEMKKSYDEEISKLNEEIRLLKNPMIYNYIDDNMPEWAREAVAAAVQKGILQGEGDGLGLSYSDLRNIVREYRLGLYN